MPDWRDRDAYSYTETLTLHQWAWELLRRNAEYREAWQRYRSANEAGKPDALYAFTDASLPFGLGEPIDPTLTAAFVGKIPWTDALGASLLDEPVPESPDKISLTFDLDKPLPAQIAGAESLLGRFQRHWARWVSEVDDSEIPTIKPRRKVHRDKLLRYIRLLDAEEAEAPIGEMGRVLFRGMADARRSAKSALETARDLAADGYRDLLLMRDE